MLKSSALAVAFAVFMAGAASAAERAVIVLDASGSMWGQIDGKPKLEIARDALRKVLKTVPADTELGLMAYGHREKGSCTDIQLIVPPAKGTEAAISSAVDAMQFLGKTPLTAAVRQAAEDLKYTEEKATVILITDGLETCDADPCALGAELKKSGVDFTAHVVGFGLTAEEGKQVACLADNTGGKYIQASDAGALEDALKTTVVATPPTPETEPAKTEPVKTEKTLAPKSVLKPGGEAPKIDVLYQAYKLDASGGKGEAVVSSYNDDKMELAPGDYIVTAASGDAKAEQKVKIEAGKIAEPVFNLNAAALNLRALAKPGAEPDRNAQIIVDYPGEGESTANFGEVKTVVPAGETKVTVKLGAAEVTETFQLAAGDTTSKDIVAGVGQISVNAYYEKGGEKVDSGDLSWEVYKAAKGVDGGREKVGYDFGPAKKFDLPAGDYVVTLDMQAAKAETPVTVAVGDAKQVDVVLDAGVAAFEAAGADGFEIFEAKKDLQGQRNKVTYGFGEKLQTTLGAGDYVLVTHFKADKPDAETPFTVQAGERVEVKVP